MMLKQTKIVASISDQRCEVEFIRDLFKAGMNVVRMNTAHASREGFEKLITNVREVSNRIAILMDTKGPEVRTTAIAGGEPIPYQIGDKVKIVGNPAQETTRECIAVSYPGFVHDLQVDGDILIDDGDLELRVIEKTDEYLLCEVQNEATLGNRKSVNVPGVRINLPSLTEKDRNNILYAIEKDIDFIAHSFVRNKQDVLDIRQILDAYGSDIKIIAKIENHEGVDNIDEIMESPDILMNSGLPVVTAFVLGLLTAISPCPLATNITAIGFISRDIGNRKRIFRNGLLYTLGRIITYTVLGLLVIPILREGASMFAIQKGICQRGEWIISPLLLLTGGFMLWGQRLNLPKFGFSGDNEKLQNLKGGVGSLTLGILFALAFCPTSGVFYFGLLIPMAAISTGGMWFSVVFAVATALPVAVVAWLLAYSIAGIGRFYNRLQVFERWMRRIVGWLFTGTGLYYLIRLL